MNGPLRIRARTRNGEVAEIEILSPRIDPSAVFVGRTPEEAVVLAGRLFSLCPMAQSIAVRAATGLPPAENEALALLGERLAEMLRASLLDWPGAAPTPDEIAALRDVLALLRRLPAAGASIDLGALQKVFARQRAEAEADEAAISSRPCGSDFLTPEDDAAVVAGLWADKAFSRAPALPGRRPETGVAARRGIVQGGMTARLAAREADMIETAAAIETILHGGPAPENLVARCGPYPDEATSRRAAAVESARGRLHHACEVDASGRIADYRIVAPTEWNFHPDGPFARLLLGARIGEGPQARRRVERLAFVFDPCIKAHAEILDSDILEAVDA